MVGLCVRNQQNIDEHYHCKICALILREPVQLICCGHRFCRSCVESQIQEQIIKCPECHEECNQDEVLLDRGFKNDMKSLIVECSLCEWKDVLMNYKDHLVQSHPNPSCQYCGTKFESMNQLDQHQLNDCEKITIPCALQKYGCLSSVLRMEIAQHYLSVEHQSAIITFIRGGMSKVVTNQAEGRSEMDVDNLSHTTVTTSSSSDNNGQLREVDETVDVPADGVQASNEDAQRLSSDSVHIQSLLDNLTKDFATLKLSIQEQNAYLDGLKPAQEILAQDAASLKQKIEDLQFVSYDGTYTWKIPNFAEKMANAQSERQTSIYSPPFYSSPTGYKMRVRLYLCGDGNARHTHASLFFVLMRSEYDAILKFPFNYKVTFCLCDHSPTQQHVIDSFRPDTKSNSFQRPRSDMNIASGIPKFCPLSTIQQEGNGYVRDDTIFIKIMVDFGDMPKNILTYILSLNLTLATDAQQRMTDEEAEQQTQSIRFPGGNRERSR